MSEASTWPSLFKLAYPSDDSVFTGTPPPFSPIDYECVTQWGGKGFTPDSRAEEAYILQGEDPLFKREIQVEPGENTNLDGGTQHPEAPWFC